MNQSFDVAIVGGGPAGSASAILLAKAGLRVVLVEKERFPRFHIGESLLPYANPILRDLGVWGELEAAGFMPKLGAEFVLSNSSSLQRFWFSDSLPAGYQRTFQVERARFDSILLEQAVRSGVTLFCPARVCDVSFGQDQLTLRYQEEGRGRRVDELSSFWLLDATGRDAWLARRLRLPQEPCPLPKRCAVYAHFAGVRRNDGRAEGHITIVRLPDGWAWFIPLDSVKTSVGLVQTVETFTQRRETPEEFFLRVQGEHRELSYRMRHAHRLSDYYVTADYSYRYRIVAGPRWLLLGDAAGFIDPIFSSGVTIALRSARLAAQYVRRAWLADKRAFRQSEQARYTRAIQDMTGVFYQMIRMFYDPKSFEVFMVPKPPLGLRQGVLQLLAGNTEPSFWIRWRVWLFYGICWLNQRWQIVPRLSYSQAR